MPSPSQLLAIGKITGTHGIRGAVKIHLYSGDDSTLRAVSEFVLRRADRKEEVVTVVTIQGQGRKTFVNLKGYASIDAALPLVGGELLIPREQFPETDEGEYYWVDLIGLRVFTDDGNELGTLREIIETGSNDVYVVKGKGKEVLIPALDDVVGNIDLEAGTMTVTLPEGLLAL